jgi:hypothetical protein
LLKFGFDIIKILFFKFSINASLSEIFKVKNKEIFILKNKK